MCKPPTAPGLAIPGRQRTLLHATNAGDSTICLNCGCSLSRAGAKVANGQKGGGARFILGAVPSERVDSSRFCTTECLYSHAFREALFVSDDDE
jgi:hypothetical protein